MLTVCIPVFNYDVRKLVSELLSQLQTIEDRSEIILIDDGSQEEFKSLCRELQNQKTTVVFSDKNTGRARTRNRFLDYARYENLLFLDCDSEIIKQDFIKSYISDIQKGYPVVCGGRIYPAKPKNKNYRLHWKYGNSRESKTAASRNLQPSRSFMTNNFMIKKQTFREVHFNEKLSAYGHEDTLFGFELQKAGNHIEHIDNPILHGSLQTNKEFLAKTVSGLQNLIFILNELNNDPEFIKNVSLLSFFLRLKKTGLNKIIFFTAPVFIPFISALLRSGFVSLRLFDSYKLFVFSRLYKKQKKD
jgi:glycosyltransferase involved in cell wall biosynthesis